MSIEKLNVDNAPTETTVTNLELDKKGLPETTVPEVTVAEVAAGLGVKEGHEQGIPKGTAEGDHDGRDGDPELVNFLLDDKDKYIRVEIRADIVDGKPVIKEDGKYLIWAKFLRPGWKLDNLIKGRRLSFFGNGNLDIDFVRLNEDIIRFLLKEWNLPLQLIFGLDLEGNEVVSNFDIITGNTGVSSTVLYELVGKVRTKLLAVS